MASCPHGLAVHAQTLCKNSSELAIYFLTLCVPAVNSVLAIGGVGGLAVGLAGREILENLFTGLIILSSSPFEVGEEINFISSPSRVSTDPCADYLSHLGDEKSLSPSTA